MFSHFVIFFVYSVYSYIEITYHLFLDMQLYRPVTYSIESDVIGNEKGIVFSPLRHSFIFMTTHVNSLFYVVILCLYSLIFNSVTFWDVSLSLFLPLLCSVRIFILIYIFCFSCPSALTCPKCDL